MTCLFGAPLIERAAVVLVEPPVPVEPVEPLEPVDPVVVDEPLGPAGLLLPPSSPPQAASRKVIRKVTEPNAFFDFDPCMRCSQGFSLVERRKSSEHWSETTVVSHCRCDGAPAASGGPTVIGPKA